MTWLDFLSHFPKQQLPANLGTLEFSTIAAGSIDDKLFDKFFNSLTDEPPSTNVRYTASATAIDYNFLTGSTTLVANEPSLNLDIDGSGNVTPLGDGVMVIRKLIGSAFADDALTDEVRSINAALTSDEIHENLQNAIDKGTLDVDGDGKTTALGDGVMIIRNLIGPAFAGDALISKAMSSDSPYFGKTDAADLVTANIDALKPPGI